MIKIDFSRPRRMSGGAFIIIFVKSFRDVFFPLFSVFIFRLLSSSSSHSDSGYFDPLSGVVIASISFGFIMASISYFTRKFYVKDGNLIFIHGLINRQDTCVPLDKVHSLRTKKGIWYRMLDLRGIVFDTLATRMAEIELILDESEWHRLQTIIENDGPESETVSAQESSGKGSTSIMNFPTGNLILAALCQNHLKGMAVLGSFLALVFDNLDEMSENATDTVMGYLDTYLEELLTSPPRIVIFLTVVYVIILVLWLGRVLFRYSEMTMRYDNKVMTFSYGLLNRASCRFLYDKICTIWIKQNLLEKRFGFSTLMLKQALNVSAEKNDDNLKIYGKDYSGFFLSWWLGKDYDREENIAGAKSGRGVFWHILIPRMALAVVIIIALFYTRSLEIWYLLPGLYLVFSLFKGLLSMRHSRIELRPTYLVIHNGAFAETANFIKYRNLEVVRIRKTPLTRWFHRVSLILSTSGSTFCIRSLKEDEAIRIYSLFLTLGQSKAIAMQEQCL